MQPLALVWGVGGLNRNPPSGKGKTQNAALDYAQMIQLLGNEKVNAEGIIIESKEVRIADNCAITPSGYRTWGISLIRSPNAK